MNYHDTYAAWQRDPEAFWLDQTRALDWHTPPTIALGADNQWFPDAVGNICANALDRHVAAGRGNQVAIVYDSPVTATQRRITFAGLLAEVEATARLLRRLGVEKGDRVVIYMPMVPEAAAAMLACARIGAIHSVVFGGFAAKELATRIDDATPKALLCASCGIEGSRVIPYKPLVDQALALATHQPTAVVVLQRPQSSAAMQPGRDHDWSEGIAQPDTTPCPPVPVPAHHPLYILYTSGTTGRPKGIVRDHAGYMTALAWSVPNLYGAQPGDTMWTASDVGWVVGHSYIVYGPLLAGCTSVLYEGKPVGTPDAGAFWRVIADHRVEIFFTAPTAIRAIRKEDPDARLLHQTDISSLRALFLAGERADPDTVAWAEQHLARPVIDHWWQTETGWPIAANPLGLGLLPTKHGSSTVPMPGWLPEVVDAEGTPVPRGTMGTITLRLPLPPGCATTIWNDPTRFETSYLTRFPGSYDTADAGMLDTDGYLWVMGRTDDVINVAGHRLSTGSMEEVVASHPAVAECAVIGVKDELKGELPCGFIVLKSGITTPPAQVAAEIVTLIRTQIGPVAALKRILPVDRLPKTRSGKILRATMRKIADGEPYTAPATIEDPTALADISKALDCHNA